MASTEDTEGAEVTQDPEWAEKLKAGANEIQIHGDHYEIDLPGPMTIEDCAGNRFDIHVGPVFAEGSDTQEPECGIWVEDSTSFVVFSKATFEAVVEYVRRRFEAWDEFGKMDKLQE